MAYARVQSAAVAAAVIYGDSTEPISMPGSVTAGNLFVVVCGSESNVRTFNVPTASNITFSRIGTSGSTGNPENGQGELNMFWGVASGPFTTITCTTSGSIGGDNSWIWAGEFSGNAASMTPTFNSAAPAATTTHASGSVTPNTAVNLIVVATSSGSADWTPDPDFTLDTNGDFDDARHRKVFYRIQTAATAQSYVATSDISRDSLLVIAAFDGTSSSSVAPLAAAYFYN